LSTSVALVSCITLGPGYSSIALGSSITGDSAIGSGISIGTLDSCISLVSRVTFGTGYSCIPLISLVAGVTLVASITLGPSSTSIALVANNSKRYYNSFRIEECTIASYPTYIYIKITSFFCQSRNIEGVKCTTIIHIEYTQSSFIHT
jgi:hypothetical protein